MKISFHLWTFGAGLMMAYPALRAEQPTQPTADAAPAESVLKKTARLIREDVRLATAAPAEPVPVLPPKDSQEEVLQLDRVFVRAPRVLGLPPVLLETPVAEFFRTGTVWERVGRKFTTKVGVKGDEGVFLRFSW
jgi:hypothetical protein